MRRRAGAASSSMEIPITWNPCCACCLCHAAKTGISNRHGAHHVAQKLSNTTFPRKAARFTVRPSRSLTAKPGACLFSRVSPEGTAAAARGAAMQQAISVRRRARRAARDQGPELVATFNWKPLTDPILAEVLSKIEDLHTSESHLLKQAVSWANVGAAIPWTAATVDDDQRRSWQCCDAAAQPFDPFGLRAGSCIFRAGNVGLVKHHARAHLQNERSFRAVRAKQPVEFIGLDELSCRNAQCARRLRFRPLTRGLSRVQRKTKHRRGGKDRRSYKTG